MYDDDIRITPGNHVILFDKHAYRPVLISSILPFTLLEPGWAALIEGGVFLFPNTPEMPVVIGTTLELPP